MSERQHPAHDKTNWTECLKYFILNSSILIMTRGILKTLFFSHAIVINNYMNAHTCTFMIFFLIKKSSLLYRIE